MAQFNYITDELFRKSLESDYREMISCIDAQAWKAALVLAGNLVEAILTDYLIASGLIEREKALKLDLGEAVKLCREKDVISQKTADLSSAIKNYRNLIHPGRLIRLNESIDKDTADVARALVNLIASEIEKKKRENYGYTAEQILAKLEGDLSAPSIIVHLLGKTRPSELERLLLKLIPDSYSAQIFNEQQPPYAEQAYKIGFRKALDCAPSEIKKKVAQNFVTIIKEENEEIIGLRVIPFMRMSDLIDLPQDDVIIAKTHLLSQLSSRKYVELLNALSGISPFLENEDDIFAFASTLIRIVGQNEDRNLVSAARELLINEWTNTQSTRSAITNIVESWIGIYTKKDNQAAAQKIQSLKASLTEETFPF